MSRWWSQKYSLPSNHELFQQETPIYWLTEYYVDYFEKNPLEVHRTEDGNIQFTDTGDSMVDRWEEQLAAGELPDLTEAFDPESLKKIQSRLKQVKRDTIPEDVTIASIEKRFRKAALEEGQVFNPSGGKYHKTFGSNFTGDE